MRTGFLLLLIACLFFGCQKKQENNEKDWIRISENIQYQENQNFFVLKSAGKIYKIPSEKLPFKKIFLLNASLVGYINAVGAEDHLSGISSPEYIYSEKVLQLIDENRIQNIGNEQKYNVEKIIALKPDAVFANYVETFENTYELLRNNGIEVIFINEYAEHHPLDKSEIVKVFGKLLGKEKASDSVYAEVEKNYFAYKNSAAKFKETPVVLANEMYGNHWFLPGGKTGLATIIKDANANYINASDSGEVAVPLSFEEVFVKAENAKYWVNAGNHPNRKSLLQVNPNYAKMKVFQHGKIYAVTGKERNKANDFFESGIVRADLLLRDYIKIFHPAFLYDEEFTYMKELQ